MNLIFQHPKYDFLNVMSQNHMCLHVDLSHMKSWFTCQKLFISVTQSHMCYVKCLHVDRIGLAGALQQILTLPAPADQKRHTSRKTAP